jgi:leucyl aminopeptidase
VRRRVGYTGRMRVDVVTSAAHRVAGDVVVQPFELPLSRALPFAPHLRTNARKCIVQEAGALTWLEGRGTRAPRVLMACLGKRSEAGHAVGWAGSATTMEQDDAHRRALRGLGGAIERACDQQLVERVVMAPAPDGIDPALLLEGMLLRAHGSTEFAPDWLPSTVRSVRVCVDGRDALAPTRARLGDVIVQAEAVNLARTLGDLPANVGRPQEVARRVRALAKPVGLSVRVLGAKELRRLGMGLVLGVAAGGAPPAIVVLEHRSRSRARVPKIVLLGKGVTIDTGGYNLKTTPHMHRYTDDKSGAVAVIAAMHAIARLGLEAHVIGVAPLLENAMCHAAYKPGDVLTAMNGATVFVENTDAEGRLVLADCLTWIARLRPDAVIDLATLSGATSAALGEPFAALYGNDARLQASLRRASLVTGELLWPMPIHPQHDAMIEHPRATLKNLGGHSGAAPAAAAFLRRFVDFPWAHVDMAGLGSLAEPRVEMGVGATGWGTRLLVEAVRDLVRAHREKGDR